MGLCEQVICHDDTLHLAAMFTCSKTVSGDKCEVDGLPLAKRGRKGFNTMQHFALFLLVYGVRGSGELHFAKVDDIVITQNQHIHLRTFLLFISPLEPRGDGGAYACYAQRLFDLRDVLPANLLKGNATPRPHDGRREIVVHES